MDFLVSLRTRRCDPVFQASSDQSHSFSSVWIIANDPCRKECAEIIANTDPTIGLDLPLRHFAGRIEGAGRVTLTTMHSAKGREFDAVIMYGVNASDLPSKRDQEDADKLRDARRSFYVGVTRPRRELCLVYQEHHQSPWVSELIERVNAG